MVACSLVLEGLTLALNERESRRNGKSRLTPIVSECSQGTSPTLSDTQTLEIAAGTEVATMSSADAPSPSNGLIFLAEDSPAKESQELGWALDSQMSGADYGAKCTDWFASLDRESCAWKTSQLCLTGKLATYSATWPRRGLMRSGECFAPAILALPTLENESGLLPTPTRSMGKRGWGLSRTGRNRYSQEVIQNAFRFGYKPPIGLLEWMMGYPQDYTSAESERLETPSSIKSQSGLAGES